MGSAWWRCGESRGAREKVSAKSDGVDDENMERGSMRERECVTE